MRARLVIVIVGLMMLMTAVPVLAVPGNSQGNGPGNGGQFPGQGNGNNGTFPGGGATGGVFPGGANSGNSVSAVEPSALILTGLGLLVAARLQRRGK